MFVDFETQFLEQFKFFDLRFWNDDKGRSERLVVWEEA